MLENSLRAIEDGVRDEPRDRWDPAYVVSVLGRDPQLLSAWVRRNTDWIPYRGVLRGPAGVLMDRQGNSLDRALLLATMLQGAGHSVRLAHGELTREQALDLLPGLVARQATFRKGEIEEEPAPALDVVAAKYALDGAAIQETQQTMTAGVHRLFDELHVRVADQTERLLQHIDLPDADEDWSRRHARAVTMLRDHWWVQWTDGTNWQDLDLLASDIAAGQPLTAARSTLGVAELPGELYHQLAVRVIAERWTTGAVTEQRVLEHVWRPFESVGNPVVLQIWPGSMPREVASDPDSRFGLRAAALAQDSWTAALAIGSDVVAQGSIGSADEATPGGGPLGGLGSAVLGAGRNAARSTPAAPAGELSAVWVEYEIRAPGETPHVIRRAVFDLFGPAARTSHATTTLVMDERKRLIRSLALMLRTEMLPIASGIAPEYLAHLVGQSLLANGTVLHSIAAGPSFLATLEPDSLLSSGAPPLSPLYSLALARSDWSRHGDVQYVDRIGILARHRHPGLMGDATTLRGAVEVVAGEFGVSLAAPNAFVIRHAQGVFDTNAEALWWTGAGLNNTGEAYASSHDWVTLTSANADFDRLSLPADATSRIRKDLASGLIVVAPLHPVPRGPDEFVGWWRIDPATGVTEGVSGNGWGQCGAEYASLEGVVARALWRGIWEYVLCQGINQVFNDFRSTAADLQARGIWFTWVGPIQTTSQKEAFLAANKGCLIGAIQAGLVSTIPFLIARSNMATRPWLMPRATWLDRFMRDQRGGIRVPPHLARGQLPGLTRAQVRGGPIVPEAVAKGGGSEPIDPLGKTQPASQNPGRSPDLGKTRDLGNTQPEVKTQPGTSQPGATMPATSGSRPQGPLPSSQIEAEQKFAAAQKDFWPASEESMNKTGDWIRYRNTGPFPEEGIIGDPDFNPDHLDKLEAEMGEANVVSDRALARVRAAEDNLTWAKDAVRKGQIPFSPKPSSPAPEGPGCPLGCGSSAGGQSGGALEAGSIGVAGSVLPGSSP